MPLPRSWTSPRRTFLSRPVRLMTIQKKTTSLRPRLATVALQLQTFPSIVHHRCLKCQQQGVLRHLCWLTMAWKQRVLLVCIGQAASRTCVDDLIVQDSVQSTWLSKGQQCQSRIFPQRMLTMSDVGPSSLSLTTCTKALSPSWIRSLPTSKMLQPTSSTLEGNQEAIAVR